MARVRHISGWTWAWAVLVLVLVSSVPASAAERLMIRFGAESGLDVDSVGEVVVGTDGALWFATALGIRRYDGFRIEPAVPDAPPLAFYNITARAEGGVFALDEARNVYIVTQEARTPYADRPADGVVWDIDTDDEGRLWMIQAGGVYRQDAPGQWSRPFQALMQEGERAARLQHDGSAMVLSTTGGVLRFVGGQAERLVTQETGETLVDAVVLSDGKVLTLDWTGDVRRWNGDVMESEVNYPGRGIDLQRRGDRVWIAWDHYFGVYGPGDQADSWRVPAGGPLAIGPDGVLIQGVFNGLFVWPEPDTATWGVTDGGPGSSIRYLHTGPGGRVLIGTWNGAGVLDPDGFKVMPRVRFPADPSRPGTVRGELCPGLDGAVWFSAGFDGEVGGVARWEPGKEVEFKLPSGRGSLCDVDADGVIWLAAGRELWRVDADGLSGPESLPIEARLVRLAGQRVWIGMGHDLCWALRSRVSGPGDWTCLDVGELGARFATSLAEVDGETLISTDGAGLLRYRRGVLERHPASDRALGSRVLHDVEVSARGGVWIVGAGVIDRVRPDDLSLLERLGAAQGVARTSAGGIVELDGGRLFLASSTGLIEVPASARQLPPQAPRPRVVSIEIDGKVQPARSVHEIGPPPNRLAIQVAALSLREPGELRFRVKIDDGKPRDMAGGSLQLVDLPSGSHVMTVQSGLPGRPWSAPVAIGLRVATPWWRTTWAMALALGALFGMIYALYRARIVWLLARERQRTGIAMDLHDELGSGLGSIRLLASVLDRDSLTPGTRKELAGRIHRVAGELHGSVQELVGSLRPGGATVGALVDRLGERARDLFADPDLEVRVVASDRLVTRALSLPARRELERIGAEALHNAARHGRGGQVTVGVREKGRRLELWVDDDGAGFDVTAEGRGLGLQSMRTRGERIGAKVEIHSRPGQGTTVSVVFDPDARDRRRRQ